MANKDKEKASQSLIKKSIKEDMIRMLKFTDAKKIEMESIWDNISMEKDTAKESSHGTMDKPLMGSGKMAKNTDSASGNLPRETTMKENGPTTDRPDKDTIIISEAPNIEDTS